MGNWRREPESNRCIKVLQTFGSIQQAAFLSVYFYAYGMAGPLGFFVLTGA